jgi:hypothetical protein
MACLLKF